MANSPGKKAGERELRGLYRTSGGGGVPWLNTPVKGVLSADFGGMGLS